jgi:pimeloyl-ACP methyl ester carboxylesterase
VLVAPVPLGGTGLPEEAVAPFKALGGDEPAQRAVRQQLTASLTGPALDRLIARGLPCSPRAVAAFVDAWNAGDRRGDAPTVFAGPVVIVSGEADGFCTAEMIEGAIVPRFPGAEHVVVAGTGHWPHAEQPEAVAAAISALLTRVAAGGS